MIKKYRKPIAVAMICMATMAGFQQSANADLRGVMDGMFANLTAPQAIRTPNYNGVAGGNLSLRMPVMGMNIINFSPPSINMGCSGIDLYMGSFTFINAAQFKALLRAIGNGIIGFAFKMAICGLSKDVCNVITDLEKWIKTLNSLAKNTCNTAKMLSNFKSDTWNQDVKDANGIFEGTKKYVDDWFSGQQKTSTSGVNAGLPISGNLTFKALWQTGAANSFGFTNGSTWSSGMGDQKVVTLLMNLAGTIITTPNLPDCDTTNDGHCAQNPPFYPKTISYDLLLNGNDNGEVASWNVCEGNIDDESGCLKMHKEALTDANFKGTKRYAKDMMFGDGGDIGHATADSIYGMVSAGNLASLSDSQFAFLAQIKSLPVIQAIYRAQNDPAALQAILKMASEIAAANMAYNMEAAAYSALTEAFTWSGLHDTHEEMKKNMKDVHAELLKASVLPGSDIDTLTKFNDLIDKIRSSVPRSYTGNVVSPQ